MKVIIKNELVPLYLLVIALIAIIIFLNLTVLRIILGLPFVLFLPGYVLTAALFPKRTGINAMERVILSFGMSIAVVPLIALVLNFTPWGIRVESILYSIASFIFIVSAIAWLRRKSLVPEERFRIEFVLAPPHWGGGKMWVNIIIVMVILGTAAILGYVATKPRAGEALPEFYILGQESTSGGYPSELVLGEEGRVMVSIVNHDYEIVSYRVEVEIDGVKNNEVKGIMLKHGEGWKQEVSFVPLIAGEKQEVQFLLYKNEDSEPCLKPLHLWLNVKEKPSE